MSNDDSNNTPPATAHAVSLKLAPFWTTRPGLWFAQAEAQFELRGITAQLTRFYYVVAALDSATASCVEDVIIAPPDAAYNLLKNRLVGIYGLTLRERAARVLDAGTLGDRSPSNFMNDLLQLVVGQDTTFIVREIFLRALPHDVATALTSSTANLCELAAEADKHFVSTGARLRGPGFVSANAVETEAFQEDSEVNAAIRPRDSSRRQRPPADARSPGLCFFHKKFGSAAFRCRAPCAYTPTPADQRQGNANAGGRR